jgi:hypothetical protein
MKPLDDIDELQPEEERSSILGAIGIALVVDVVLILAVIGAMSLVRGCMA